jgi:serine/threonine protein kinase
MLKHPNVLEMKDSFFTYEGDKEYLNVVMDYYGCNLYEFLHKYSRKNPIPRLPFKLLAYQLIRSLLYLRKLSISHRDIKPQNILINEQNNKLVLCDFGSAKQLKPSEPNISYICSRCYRAPELIFGFTQYTTQVDMWSIGCVIGEMIGLKPLFQGDSNIDQLV